MKGLRNKESGQWKKWASFLFLLFLFLGLLHSAKNVYQKKKMAQETLARMEKEAVELKERDKFLKQSIERMATIEGLEFEMRKKLNVAQVGESVVVIVDDEEASTTLDSKISTWQKFKNFWVGFFR